MGIEPCAGCISCGQRCETSSPFGRERHRQGVAEPGEEREVSGGGDQEDCQGREPGSLCCVIFQELLCFSKLWDWHSPFGVQTVSEQQPRVLGCWPRWFTSTVVLERGSSVMEEPGLILGHEGLTTSSDVIEMVGREHAHCGKTGGTANSRSRQKRELPVAEEISLQRESWNVSSTRKTMPYYGCDLPRSNLHNPRFLICSPSFFPNQGAVRTLAKQLVQLRAQKDQLYAARARIAGVGNAAASAATTGNYILSIPNI